MKNNVAAIVFYFVTCIIIAWLVNCVLDVPTVYYSVSQEKCTKAYIEDKWMDCSYIDLMKDRYTLVKVK